MSVTGPTPKPEHCIKCQAPHPFHVDGCSLCGESETPPDWNGVTENNIHDIIDFVLRRRGFTDEQIAASRARRGLDSD